MKANQLASALLFLLSAAVFQQCRQQTQIDRKDPNEIRAKAEAGNAASQYRLGLRYYNGEGVAKDFSEAAKWFRKAAERGFAKAQGYLGRCYFRGEGVTQDFSEAVKWSRKAADQGDSPGQNNLGSCYHEGQGVAKD